MDNTAKSAVITHRKKSGTGSRIEILDFYFFTAIIADYLYSGFSAMKLITCNASAGISGFPSPAVDYIELPLSLDQQLVEHPSSTLKRGMTLKQTSNRSFPPAIFLIGAVISDRLSPWNLILIPWRLAFWLSTTETSNTKRIIQFIGDTQITRNRVDLTPFSVISNFI